MDPDTLTAEDKAHVARTTKLLIHRDKLAAVNASFRQADHQFEWLQSQGVSRQTIGEMRIKSNFELGMQEQKTNMATALANEVPIYKAPTRPTPRPSVRHLPRPEKLVERPNPRNSFKPYLSIPTAVADPRLLPRQI